MFGDKLKLYTGVARQLFWQTLNDTEAQVQQASVMAVCSFVENLTHDMWKQFQELLPAMLLIIERAIVTQDDASLLKVITLLLGAVQTLRTLTYHFVLQEG